MTSEGKVLEIQEHIDDTDGADYTAWEIDFIDSMGALIDEEREFTESQTDKIEEIYRDYLD